MFVLYLLQNSPPRFLVTQLNPFALLFRFTLLHFSVEISLCLCCWCRLCEPFLRKQGSVVSFISSCAPFLAVPPSFKSIPASQLCLRDPFSSAYSFAPSASFSPQLLAVLSRVPLNCYPRYHWTPLTCRTLSRLPSQLWILLTTRDFRFKRMVFFSRRLKQYAWADFASSFRSPR